MRSEKNMFSKHSLNAQQALVELLNCRLLPVPTRLFIKHGFTGMINGIDLFVLIDEKYVICPDLEKNIWRE
jgi:hypothetical protein